MTGSMYAAVAGLKTHMDALNVIGNNIANVNTNGYKSTRYTFNEALYSTVRSGSNGSEELGGRNPAQVGYGCSVGTIDLDMSTGTPNPTGHSMDCMIDGDGFFLVGDKTKTGVNTQAELNGMRLTRVGNFEFKDGYLCDGNGQVVYGFLNTANPQETAVPSYSPVLTPIRLPWFNKATGQIYMPSENTETDPENPSVEDDADAVAARAEATAPGSLTTDSDIVRLKFNNMTIDQATGLIVAITDTDIQVTIGALAIGKVDSPNGVTHTDGRYYMAMGGAGDVRLTSLGGVIIYPVLDAEGNPIEEEEGQRLVVSSAGSTTLMTGFLEQSKTDLADEITHMIVIQRGYQANTRIVTVTDSMLEELINMKR